MNPVYEGFWAGWVSYVVFLSFVQDVMGKQRYLHAAARHWIGGGSWRWVFVAAEILALLGCLAFTYTRSKEHS
jgi:hypothetical protein